MSDVAYALATMARDINELRKENKRLRQDLAAARKLLEETRATLPDMRHTEQLCTRIDAALAGDKK